MVGGAQALAAGDLRVAGLKTEYGTDPIGLDVERPRLSWILQSHARNVMQAAYQITAKTSDGAVWDSGRVESDQSIHIPYGGPPLKARTRVAWKVRVWDKQGRTAESKPASFEMGL